VSFIFVTYIFRSPKVHIITFGFHISTVCHHCTPFGLIHASMGNFKKILFFIWYESKLDPTKSSQSFQLLNIRDMLYVIKCS